MVRSMTGFGRADATTARGKIQVEIRTVNHRFFEISSRLPENLNIFEDKIRAEVAKKVKRGKVNLSLTYENPARSEPKLAINKPLANKYKGLLVDLRRSLRLTDEINFSQIIAFPGVIYVEESPRKEAEMWPCIRSALGRAIDGLIEMREKEGARLIADIAGRRKTILKCLTAIERRSKLALKEYRLHLLRKIKELSSGKINLDKGRIELEVALFAKSSDISEEITRLKAHLKSFGETITGQDEVGRKLDFISQELHREINTVGQKTSDYKIAQLAISIKGEVEKIREQIQNVE
ncbi:MAG TPA: YicC family protein [Candidatus Omnitrophota bacterium]|nr:YicC family protein [Candidatus Omnitrophota bacterium]